MLTENMRACACSGWSGDYYGLWMRRAGQRLTGYSLCERWRGFVPISKPTPSRPFIVCLPLSVGMEVHVNCHQTGFLSGFCKGEWDKAGFVEFKGGQTMACMGG